MDGEGAGAGEVDDEDDEDDENEQRVFFVYVRLEPGAWRAGARWCAVCST